MPVPNNLNAFLGAAVLGVISAAGLYLVEHYRQEKRRYAMAKDLARLDQELSTVKRELHDLMAKKRDKFATVLPGLNMFGNAYLSMSGSPIDNSPYAVYFKWNKQFSWSQKRSGELSKSVLSEIDRKLDEGNVEELNSCLVKLQDLCLEHPGNVNLLWRIGKAHLKLSERSTDKSYIQNQIEKGVEACTKALELDPRCAAAHKWMAILIGGRGDFQSMKDRIADGHLLKQHVDKALELDPNDPSLHHMLGRFCFEVAGLKWYERKVAATLFGEPPNSTYGEALDHLMKCESLADFQWKENKLYIAKCFVAQNQLKDAVQWLEKAQACKGDGLDDNLDSEIKVLLAKYNSYR
ncbi:regulator of microtubule dynamics protein 1 isoform X3 [Aethina tumida]|uniref:regulator of microtubule dynamics protein 1 isoform X3 n=1 Tax=Aethina tumida TaxID=116153 RepID=UPI0021492752|nr:regulator of microtubule dynamics protein 1 isoform X3 [Aethina tumida]